MGHINPQARFEIASKLAGTEFLERLDYYATAWLPARDLVWEAMQKRFEVDESGLIVMFDRVRISFFLSSNLPKLTPKSPFSLFRGKNTSTPWNRLFSNRPSRSYTFSTRKDQARRLTGEFKPFPRDQTVLRVERLCLRGRCWLSPHNVIEYANGNRDDSAGEESETRICRHSSVSRDRSSVMLLDLLVVSLLSTKALTELIGPGTMITGNQTKEGALEMARRSIKGE
jgi:hypothetical protein